MLGCGISRDILTTDTRGNRGNINDATATLVYQHWYKSLGYIVDAGQVDRQHALPEFIGMIQEFVASRITGVIDQDIYPT